VVYCYRRGIPVSISIYTLNGDKSLKKFITINALIILMSIPPLFCHAEELSGKPSFSKPFMKVGRGMINIVSSPLELPNQMYLLSSHAHDNSKYGIETASAAIEGFLIGVVYSFWRLGAGTYDLFTFPLSKYETTIITPAYFTVSYEEYYEDKTKEKQEGNAEQGEQ
jgi:putative exosortase-associated protein (TIGR04073 family)